MKNFIWRIIAFIVSRQVVTNWLIKHARRRPYTNIMSPDGKETYMTRLWVFNPYGHGYRKARDWLPSIRLHHIMRPDMDTHCHDHPWDARTIILNGWYIEHRLRFYTDTKTPLQLEHSRFQGDTATLKYGEYHRIHRVSPGGVWTMFITWKYQGPWGFYVEGVKVLYRQYIGSKKFVDEPTQ